MEIECPELARLLAAGTRVPRLIDCRESDELAICKIPSVEHRPLSLWGGQWANWFTDKDEQIVVICHHGMRSLRATVFLRERGFHHTRSLAGGVESWAIHIDPKMARY